MENTCSGYAKESGKTLWHSGEAKECYKDDLDTIDLEKY